MDEALRRQHGKVCLYLFLGALAVRVLYLSQYAGSPFFWAPALDALYHDQLARGIATGHSPTGPFFRAPLYYYFLGGIYWLIGPNYWGARLVQAMLGSGSCVLLYAIGCRLAPRSTALLAAGMMALYGPLVFFDGELLIPPVLVFLILATLLVTLRARDDARPGTALAAGTLLGLAAIARPNALVLAPLLAAGLATGAPCGPRALRWLMPVLFLLATAIFPAIVTARNAIVGGEPVWIASQGGINFWLGNRPGVDGFTPSTPWRYDYEGPYQDSVALFGQRAAEEALGRRLTANEAQAYWYRRGLEWWRRDPLAALALTWKKWVLLWSHREIRNNRSFEFVRAEFAPALWLAPFGFWLAGPLGLLGMIVCWRRDPRWRWLALAALLYLASFVPFFVADRYRLPAVPLLLLFAAMALRWLVDAIRTLPASRWLPRVGALAALAIFVLVDWYPTESRATRALDHWSAGNAALELGRPAEARTRYRRALALDPNNAEIWTNYGAACYAMGDLTAAAAAFRAAIARDRRSVRDHANLAICLRELGRAQEARAALEIALRLQPDHTLARNALREIVGGSAPSPRSEIR